MMKKFIISILSIVMLFCFGAGLVACGDSEPITLQTPTLTATDTTLNWTAIDNATNYTLRINGNDQTVTSNTYTLDNVGSGQYTCSVRANGDGEQYLSSVFSQPVVIKVVFDEDAPEISLANHLISVDKNTSFELNQTNLGLTVVDASDYAISYSVKYNGEESVTLTNNTLQTGNDGFYTVDVKVTDANGISSVKRVNLVVNGTYLYSLDGVTDIEAGEDWFVRNSSLKDVTSTTAEIVSEPTGNKYYKLTAKAGEKTTFNMPLPAQNGVTANVNKPYKVYITLWTDANLADSDNVAFWSAGNMTDAKGKLDKDNQRVILTANFSGAERLSTFYIQNNTANELSYCIDNIMLIEMPTYSGITVTSNATVTLDQNDDIVLTNSSAWSTYRFALDELQNYNAGDIVKVTLKYKTVGATAANNECYMFYGTYAGKTKGDLVLVKDGADYTTVQFNAMVYTGKGEYPDADSIIVGDLDKHIKITTLFTSTGGVAVNGVKILIDSITAVKEEIIATSGAVVSTNSDDDIVLTNTGAWSTYKFFLDELKDCLPGAIVKVTMQYKTVGATAANNEFRVIYGTGEGDSTLFFNVVKDGANYTTAEFDAMVYTGANEYPYGSMVISGDFKPHLKITTLFTSTGGKTVNGVQILIDSITVETGITTKYGFVARETDLGLGGNTIYFLPSTTGMQSLSMVIKNTQGEIYIIDGGYDSEDYGDDDAKLLFDVISDLCDGEDLTIKGWFFTHPHSDHIGVFADFVGKYGSQVSIDTIYYSWSEQESWYKQFTETPDVSIDLVNKFKNAIPNGTTVVEPKVGDTYNFGSFTFDILYSPANDNYPFTGNDAINFNNLSLVIKMTTNEKSILFLGDAGVAAGQWLLANCSSSELKADIVQMAHHGQAGVNENVYQAIDPDVALWNCDRAVYENDNGNLQTLVVRGWMEKLGTTNYVSKDGIYIFN